MAIQLKDGKFLLVDGKLAMHKDCCCGCEVFVDEFNRSNDTDIGPDWDEVSGDWSIASNNLSITDDDGICKCETDGTLSYIVRVGCSGGTTGDEWRLIFDYTDSNNYSYARIVRSTLTSRIYLVSVSGGSHTVIFTGGNFDFAFAQRLYVEACVHSNYVIIATSTSADFALYTPRLGKGVTHTIGTCGLGTGTNAATPVKFDNFRILNHEQSQSNCPDCRGTCRWCIDDLVAERYQVVITGVTGANDCSDFNGTWILTGFGCGFDTGVLDFVTQPGCSGDSSLRLLFIFYDLLCVSPADTYSVRVLFGGGSSTTCVADDCGKPAFLDYQNDEYDCDDLIELSLAPGNPPVCDVSSATCTVTAL